ncbi:MAG: hypothetical protein GY865_06675 [candidate division Zixibacteria bacterium]|nr:hypothetical protein [candidate division Zixibacteria bacterium]
MTTSMDISFIGRTLKTTSVLVLFIVTLGSLHYPFNNILAIVSGTVWSIINLYFLTLLVRAMIRPEGPDKMAVGAFLFIKVPLLYLAGYFLLTTTIFQTEYLAIGFSLPLAVILLKVLGRVLLGLDKKEPNHNSQQEAA